MRESRTYGLGGGRAMKRTSLPLQSRAHHAARRRGGVAGGGERAAAGDAGGRVLNGQTAQAFAPAVAAFRRGLNEAGYVEGQNVRSNTAGQREAGSAAAARGRTRRRQVAVIAATGGKLALVAMQATSTIPIVFTSSDNPVERGLVASINRPGGNVTGVSWFSAELGPKRLGLLHELVPNATIVALLVNPNET